ncbi:hypothetical protein HID58_062988 [Brassica napus]|uniref:Uncharacterized protein n=1 Tax=Brassica napus TaxID=3708 RepID=A0ABQ8A2X4_BRANA|nr:hypothetical protein HID58_062988 [Brassica napus]
MNTGQDEEPLPSTGTRRGDGTPPTAKTNHGRTNLHKGSNRRAKTDEDKLEDAKTKSIGEKNRRRYRARDNRSTKNWIVDGSVPARTILSKTSSPRDRGRRSRRYESHRFPEAKPHDHRRY